MDGREWLRRTSLLLVISILLIVVVACVPLPPSTVEPRGGPPTDTPRPEPPFEVRREIPAVRAGLSDILPELTDSEFHPLHDGHRVKTDARGEALLRRDLGGAICYVYLFLSSQLVKRACPKSSYAGGNTTCLEEGSAVFNGCSNHLIMTPSSEILVRGSWVSVTYLPDQQMTLVVVSEGEAEVRPVLDTDTWELGLPISVAPGQLLVTAPDPVRGQDFNRETLPVEALSLVTELLGIDAWMARASVRAEGDRVPFWGPESVSGGNGSVDPYLGEPYEVGEQEFQGTVLESPVLVLADFTASWCAPCQTLIPVLEELAWEYAGDLIVARVDTESDPQLAARYDVRELPALLFFQDGTVVDAVVGPQSAGFLRGRIEELLGWSEEEPGDVIPPVIEVEPEAVRVLVEMGGGVLEERLVQQAVASAVDWLAIIADVFPDQQSSVYLDLQGSLVDAFDVTFDPRLARKRLAEAGYPDAFRLQMSYPAEDESLAIMAEWVESYLGEIGVGIIPTLLGETFDEPLRGEQPTPGTLTLGEVLSGRPTLRLIRASQ
ncbi:MAG TPA: thioredoxin domain-containing protein [Anaerolineae bacterium]|nr:thioredoxin domain-containing protein [Anaerolineae bacterium]